MNSKNSAGWFSSRLILVSWFLYLIAYHVINLVISFLWDKNLPIPAGIVMITAGLAVGAVLAPAAQMFVRPEDCLKYLVNYILLMLAVLVIAWCLLRVMYEGFPQVLPSVMSLSAGAGHFVVLALINQRKKNRPIRR